MNDNSGSATGGQPGGDAAGGNAGGEWHASIADEGLRGYVQAKGFKDPGALADSYRNLEKLVGVPQERLLKIPERSDDAEGWNALHNRLGRPADAKGYELQFEGDPAFAERFGGVFHEAGISKSQAGKLNQAWNEYVKELVDTDTRERAQKDAAEIEALRGKWGGDFDKNAELGRRAGREFGLSEDEFKSISGSLGSAKTLELFQRIGSKLGEAQPFDTGGGQGGGSGFGMTREAAAARIKALSTDRDWTGRYLAGGAAEREEMTRLQQIAAGSA